MAGGRSIIGRRTSPRHSAVVVGFRPGLVGQAAAGGEGQTVVVMEPNVCSTRYEYQRPTNPQLNNCVQ